MQKLSKAQKLIWGVMAVLIGLAAITLLFWKVFNNKPITVFAPDYWPTEGWQSNTPEQQGLDSAKIAEGLESIQQNHIPIHSLMIAINGYAVVEATFYPYDSSSPHNVGSVTKALITTLIGIAIDQGKLKIDDRMVAFFPTYTIAHRDAQKDRIMIKDLLSMSSGMECAGLPTEATQREMEASMNWVQFALDRPVIHNPGTTFVYCGPDMHLLSAILQAATGMTALEFAQQNLFEPLGFREVLWPSDPQGINMGAGNVRLFPEDMTKLGFLYLQRGHWDNLQIIPPSWVKDALHLQGIADGDPYGYGWRVNNGDNGYEFYTEGMGGQRILVIPGLNTILVTTGGGFDIDQVIPYLTQALIDVGHALPENRSGFAELQAVLAKLSKAPQPLPVSLLPDVAKVISGKTIMLDENPLQIESLQLEFNETAEARIQFNFTDGRHSPWATIGLDGDFRNTTGVGIDQAIRSSLEIENQAVGIRGTWTDAQTFALEYDTLTNRYVYRMLMHFEGNDVMIDLSEQVYGDQVTFSGHMQNP
ncbi:MAG: serine hydrolase [Anaerolineales bacterium]